MRTLGFLMLFAGLLAPAFGQNFEGTIHWAVRFDDQRPAPKEPPPPAVAEREKRDLEGMRNFFPKGLALDLKGGNARFTHEFGVLGGDVFLLQAGKPGYYALHPNMPGIALVHPPSTPTPAALAAYTTTRTDETGSFLGYPTRKYMVVGKAFSRRPEDDMHITVWATTGLAGADSRALVHMNVNGEGVYLPQIEGLPLKFEYEKKSNQGFVIVIEVDRIDRRPLADGLFQLPAGTTEKVVEPQPPIVLPNGATGAAK